ncbi:MAG TPA: hypothetical protein VMZ06_05050 [Candidatus Bathyarchaeia archaeon]|nr:hypothetical protein [Candidatus Bathyarchaeia archaeon]
MRQTVCLQLKGANAGEVAGILACRLVEFQCRAKLERPSSAAECNLRIATAPAAQAAENLAVELDAHDTPDFAAEKVIDILAENGVISLPAADYTPEEEEKIRRRLQDLGYIE